MLPINTCMAWAPCEHLVTDPVLQGEWAASSFANRRASAQHIGWHSTQLACATLCLQSRSYHIFIFCQFYFSKILLPLNILSWVQCIPGFVNFFLHLSEELFPPSSRTITLLTYAERTVSLTSITDKLLESLNIVSAQTGDEKLHSSWAKIS